ncbi:ABC transporter ATP-binding protein [Kineococcus gypseus]|uniref:ABC transporter ATP-binding protein n=1 Tax=Kineococcus gypseus TaxID=1637102 RepID=UPI003D7EC96C
MIEVAGLRKVYRAAHRDVVAVDELTFSVRPGAVTGFLGPNGAGKSTTMRMIAGLEAPSAGHALVAGRPFTEHSRPMSALGVLLEAKAMHPGRTARRHLQVLAATNGLAVRQVDTVLELVGLADAAERRVGAFSMGMGQRLGLAAALLGDPAGVMLDEPLNGLDPDGIVWMRELLQQMAAQGRTVFLSSHLMSEMALTADHLIVVAGGRLLADESMSDFLARTPSGVRVASPQAAQLREALEQLVAHRRAAGHPAALTAGPPAPAGSLIVQGVTAVEIGRAAQNASVVLSELVTVQPSLEEAFMKMTTARVSAHTQ